MKLFYSILFLISIFLLNLIFINSVNYPENPAPKTIYHYILNPYGNLIQTNERGIKTNDKNAPLTVSRIPYLNFKYNSLSENGVGIPDSSLFCRIGGDYKIGLYLNVPEAPKRVYKRYVKNESDAPNGKTVKKIICKDVCSTSNFGDDSGCSSYKNTCEGIPGEFILESKVQNNNFNNKVKTERYALYYNEEVGGKINSIVNLFHCDTSKEFLNQIKIPSSWANNDIYVYCNDGAKINFFRSNPDFLTSRFNIYKACIVKNLDLDEDNTIFYAKEVGNDVVDSKKEYFFDSGNNSDFVSNLNFVGMDGVYYKYKDSLFDYFLKYDPNNNIFVITKGKKLSLDTNIINNVDIGNSRVFLKRQIAGKQINGFEKPYKYENQNFEDEISPVYIIRFDNYFGLTKNFCEKGLGIYGLSQTATMNLNEKVYCDNNMIKINSRAFEIEYGSPKGQAMAFDLFKNIILNLY